MDASLGEILALAAAILAAGVVTGLLAGLFGIGGGAVIVPVLYEVFRLAGVPEAVRMQLCIGTSLAIIVPTAWRSYRAHQARGLVLPEVLAAWTVPAIFGVALGSLAVQRQDHEAAIERLRAITRTCGGIVDGSAAGECSEALTVLAEALLRSGRLDEAAVTAQEAARRRRELEGDASPDSARPTRIHGEVLLAQGHAEQALERFDLAARLYEGAGMRANIAIADLLVARARALLALGRSNDALGDLDRATPMLASLVPVSGRRLRLFATKASAFAALGRVDEARAVARAALALAPARAAIDAAEWDALQALAR